LPQSVYTPASASIYSEEAALSSICHSPAVFSLESDVVGKFLPVPTGGGEKPQSLESVCSSLSPTAFGWPLRWVGTIPLIFSLVRHRSIVLSDTPGSSACVNCWLADE